MHSKHSTSSSSRIYIDISEDENVCSESKAEFLTKCRKEMSALQTQVLALQKENSELKSKLTVTQSELGKAVVANVMQVNYSTTKDDVKPAESSKRLRSPSLEFVHTPLPMGGKGKVKEEIMSPQPKKIKIENSMKISPSQMRIWKPPSLTRPITPRAEPEPFSMVTRSQSGLKLKRPGANCPSFSSQPDLNPFSSASKVIRPRQSASAPLIADLSSRKSRDKRLVTRGGHDSDLLFRSLKMHLTSAPTLPIHPPPLKVKLKRVPFIEYYGGTFLQLLQYISADKNPSGNIRRNLVFPQPQDNPALPVGPGEPGLIFASRHEVANGSPWSLFIKRDPAVAVWTYLGDYKGEVCGQLTSDQFKTLSETEQAAWVNRLLTQKSGVYLKMRIRIALRKGGLIPLVDEEEEEKLIAESTKCESDFNVTKEDIRTALHNGDEVIDLILMTCIFYDHVFANDIRRNFNEDGTRRTTVGFANIPDGDTSDDQSNTSDDIYVSD